jgi:hypothetical protein
MRINTDPLENSGERPAASPSRPRRRSLTGRCFDLAVAVIARKQTVAVRIETVHFPAWQPSELIRVGRRFAAENAITQREIERSPIPPERNSL